MITKQRILAKTVPEPAAGTFSQAFSVGDTIYISGQHAGEPDGSVAGGDDVRVQSVRALEKIKALLEAAGATMDDIVKLNVFLTDISNRAAVREARRQFFHGDFPCSTLVAITALAEPGLFVEIDAIAVRGCSS